MNSLHAENISKAYRQRRVVDQVSLSVHSGQVVGLLGPNGAGKTTCFYMLVGLIACDSGRILINGQDVSQAPIHVRAKMGLGYLPQEASVFRKLSVFDNIMAILETRDELSQAQREARCESLMNEFQIGHLRDSMGMSLSGGERRRLEIARALATDPHFILLDEPFAGVDPISVVEIKRIIQQLTDRGIGVLITDHNVRETLDVCEHAYIMNDGHFIAQGVPEEILQNQQVRDVYLGEQFRL